MENTKEALFKAQNAFELSELIYLIKTFISWLTLNYKTLKLWMIY